MPALLEPLSLVVSELAGNAVRHGRPPFQLALRRVGIGVRAVVHDEGPKPLAFPEADAAMPPASAEGGRGLGLIRQVSTSAGVENIPHDGKNVWAVVEPAPDSGKGAGPTPA